MGDSKERNRTLAALERDRLAKQRKAAAERAMGIRRCRKGHRLSLPGFPCERCAEIRRINDTPTEADLVNRILYLDRLLEHAATHEKQQYRDAIKHWRDRIDELDRTRRQSRAVG